MKEKSLRQPCDEGKASTTTASELSLFVALQKSGIEGVFFVFKLFILIVPNYFL